MPCSRTRGACPTGPGSGLPLRSDAAGRGSGDGPLEPGLPRRTRPRRAYPNAEAWKHEGPRGLRPRGCRRAGDPYRCPRHPFQRLSLKRRAPPAVLESAEEVEDEMREFFRCPPLNHVVGFLDYGSPRTRDLAGEEVADLVEVRHVTTSGDDERRDADLTKPSD